MEATDLKGFVFYRSFYEALKGLPEELRGRVVDGVCSYAFEGVEPSGDPLVQSLFLLMKPNVDASVKRYQSARQNGLKGGAPKENRNAKQADPARNDSNNPTGTQNQPAAQPKNNRRTTHKQPDPQPKNNPAATENQPENREEKEIKKEVEIEKEIEAKSKIESERAPETEAVAAAFAECGINLKAHQMREAEVYLAQGMPPEILAEAARRAADAGAARWNYAKGILNKWQRLGVKTLTAVRAEDASFRQRQGRRAPPAWQLSESQRAPLYVGRIYTPEELAEEDPWKMS